MLDLPGSNLVIETIQKLQAKNKELDPDCVLKDYYKPDKSFFNGWLGFFMFWKSPGKLKKK